MADFAKLVADLKSKRPSTRYDACEELRVAPEVSDEATIALRTATSDPDPAVAEAAGRALAIHTSPSLSVPPHNAASGPPQTGVKQPAIVTWGPGILALVMLVLMWILIRDFECVAGLAPIVITPIILLVVKLGVFRSLAQLHMQILNDRGGYLRARQMLLYLGIGVVFAILGYALGYAVASAPVIRFFAGPGAGEWERGVVENEIIHGCCAGPLLVVLGSVFAVLATLLGGKLSTVTRCLILATITFIAAFVAYLPLQVLFILAAAF